MDPSDPRKLGGEIRRWRARRSMTQEGLAGAAGISTRHLSYIENDRSRPARDTLLRISSAMSLPPRDRDLLLEQAGHARHRGEEPPTPIRVLDSPEEIRALADPLRLDLLRSFAEPRSPKAAAERLGVPTTRVSEHLELLERAGLVEPVETRGERGEIETRYRATASIFQLDAAVPGAPCEGGAAREEAWSELAGAMVDSPGLAKAEFRGPAVASRAVISIDEKDFSSLIREIQELFERYEAAALESRSTYRFTMVGVPYDPSD